jgi:hypothetical protein
MVLVRNHSIIRAKTSYLQSFFSVILIFFCLILNQSAMSNALIAAVLLILFFLNLNEYAFARKRASMYILFFSFLISGVIGFLADDASENIFRYLGLLILVISFPLGFTWSNKYLYYLLFITGVCLVFLQLGSGFGIGQAEGFIKHFYPIDHNLWDEEAILLSTINQYAEGGSSLRYGGVFYNPNIMGQIMVFWYIIMRNFSIQTQRFSLIVFLITLVSILFSGSRTAFLVFFIYSLVFYWAIIRRYAFVFSIIIICFVLLSYLSLRSSGNFRIFNISQGITAREGSGIIKYGIFRSWVEEQTIPANFDLKKFLFGNLSWDVEFDNDPGYILNFFGFAGALFLLYFLFDIYKHSTRLGKLNFCLLLIGLGATVIMNFRFSILLFLVLSIGYNHLSIQKLKS